MSVDTDIAELFSRVEALEANPVDTGLKFDTIPNAITGASSQFGHWLDILTTGGGISPLGSAGDGYAMRFIDSSGAVNGATGQGIKIAVENPLTNVNAGLFLTPLDDGVNPPTALASLTAYQTALISDTTIEFRDSGSHNVLLQTDQDGTFHVYGNLVGGNREKFRIDANGTIHGLASVGAIVWDLP